MRDDIHRTAPGGAGAPRDWSAAFAALPLERPDTDAWQDIAQRLPVRHRANRWIAGLAIAAVLALAVVVPLRLLGPTPSKVEAPTQTVVATTPAPTDPLEQLYAESAQLESVLAIARDDTVSSGSAAEVAANLDAELARIDAQLRTPDLPRDRQIALWQARVEALRSSVTFEGTRRLLASHGEGYDGALVRVD
ncbi:hypothetical protein LVB87_00970 [Lysobacter sp. KIS68-7]|uniref:hypothetical protein n=1 Tax=Lysobacter sp. KIS68-7 TaxID=2904252 RepID=UPI001E407770|nr:hypothetical protein [Lysobacter sp. KIS68-7]UHQ19773.1 hypothetical protein LVB87_00970 [Lysobacter sp. KIS68-7]